MRISFTITFLTILISACQNVEKPIEKMWLGQSVDFSHLKPVTNTYSMYDSSDSKIGSMIFSFSFESGFLVARDTSQFDDGSIYETAEFTFDTLDFKMRRVGVDMRVPGVNVAIRLKKEGEKIKGEYDVTRDTTTSTFKIDSAYQFSNFRGEIYMFMHALTMQPNDTILLRSLEPTSMDISEGVLVYTGTESIETFEGVQLCDVLMLQGDGKIPDNKIWVKKKSPRTIVKFHIPDANMNIVLERQHINQPN